MNMPFTRAELERHILKCDRKIEFDIEEYAWLSSAAMDDFIDAWRQLSYAFASLHDKDLSVMALDTYFKRMENFQDVLDYDSDPSFGLVFTEQHRTKAKQHIESLRALMWRIREEGWRKYNSSPESDE